MRVLRPGLSALTAGLILVAAGCGSSAAVPDSKLIAELKLKHTARGYEMGGDPFCTIDKLLNDGGEVSHADDQSSAEEFVIASPDGKVGVVAKRPFAPDCSKRAQHKLKKLERRSG
jgi:hypothetical protein